MAVQLEFINIIIKRESIHRIVSGSWKEFVRQMEPKHFNDCFDDHLFRTGAMSFEDAFDIAHELNDIGFLGLALGDNSQRYWSDFCVFDSSVGTEYNVDWLDLDYHRTYPYAIRLAGDSEVVIHTPDTCYSPFRSNNLEPIYQGVEENEDSVWGAIRQAQGRRAYEKWLSSRSKEVRQ